MNNAQSCDCYINIPSSQTYRYFLACVICLNVYVPMLCAELITLEEL
jgi:hypothetical protein